MKRLATYLLCLCIVLLPGCALMTPQQRSAARESIEAEYRAGNITRTQADAAIEAVDNPEGIDWEGVLKAGGSVLVSLLLGVPVTIGAVQKIRGPSATQAERAARSAARRPGSGARQ